MRLAERPSCRTALPSTVEIPLSHNAYPEGAAVGASVIDNSWVESMLDLPAGTVLSDMVQLDFDSSQLNVLGSCDINNSSDSDGSDRNMTFYMSNKASNANPIKFLTRNYNYTCRRFEEVNISVDCFDHSEYLVCDGINRGNISIECSQIIQPSCTLDIFNNSLLANNMNNNLIM